MKYLGLAATAALLASTGSVFALDFGPGFSLTGKVELEYLDGESSNATYGFTDLTLSWRSQSGGALTFGADVAYKSLYDVDSGDNVSAIWAGLVVGTSFGEFSIGRPRPVLDTMFDTPDVAGSELLDLSTSAYTESITSFIMLTADGSVDPYGVTFKGQSGALGYGVGVHRIDQGGASANFLEGGITYALGSSTLFASYESVDLGSSSLKNVNLGGKYAADRWSVGAMYSHLTAGSTTANSYKLFGDYKVTEALTVGVQVEDVEVPFSGTIVGINGSYSFGKGFAELGLGSADSGGSTNTFGTASIGFKF